MEYSMYTENNNILKVDSSYSEYVVRSACSWAFPASENFPNIKYNVGSWILIFDSPLSYDSKVKFKSYIKRIN